MVKIVRINSKGAMLKTGLLYLLQQVIIMVLNVHIIISYPNYSDVFKKSYLCCIYMTVQKKVGRYMDKNQHLAVIAKRKNGSAFLSAAREVNQPKFIVHFFLKS